MQEQQQLPFVVESVTAERVQFWMQYAGQASTQNEFLVVSHAYNAFWHEASLYERSVKVQNCLRQGDMPFALAWADLMVQSLNNVLRNWQGVVSLMEAEYHARTASWYQFATQHLSALFALREHVATLVMQWCTQQNVPFPEYTQAFVTAMQQ